MSFRFTALLYCAVLWSPLNAAAQQRANTSGPTHPGVAVPAMKYESAFTDYIPFRDQKLAPWREANDEAAQVGGHLGIFSGTAKPADQAPASSAKPAAPEAPHMKRGNGQQGIAK